MENVPLEKVDRLVIRDAVIRWIRNWRMHLYLVKDRQSKKESKRKNLLQCLTIRWKRFWNTRLKMTNRTRPAIGVIAASEMLTLRRLDDGVYLFHLRLYRVIHHRPIPSTFLSILVHHFFFFVPWGVVGIEEKSWFNFVYFHFTAQDLAANSNVQDAFVIAVEKQAREWLERLSALKKIKPVDMTKLSQQVKKNKWPIFNPSTSF